MKKCYRLLIQLPVASVLLALPFIYTLLENDTLNFVLVPVSYFIASLIVIINFPSIIELLYAKPLYIEDLEPDSIHTEHTAKFKQSYHIAMNLCLSALFASISEYIIIQGIRSKPIVEILAIIGGNIALFMKIQNIVGKCVLYICHCMKTREVRRLSDATTPSQSPHLTPINLNQELHQELHQELELT